MLAVLSRRDVITAAMLGSAAYIGLSPVPSGAEGMKPIQSLSQVTKISGI